MTPQQPDGQMLNNFRYQELEFAKDGSVVHPEEAAAVAGLAGSVTDLIVMSHGWNNDMDEARGLYRALTASMSAVLPSAPIHLGGRSLGVLGVLWPSKRFTDAELIPGGAAGLVTDPTLPDDLRGMSDAFAADDAQAKLDRAAELADQLDDSLAARNEYADVLRSLIRPASAEPADAADELFSLSGDDLLQRLQNAMIAAMTGLPPIGAPAGLGGVQALPPVGVGLGGIGGLGGPAARGGMGGMGGIGGIGGGGVGGIGGGEIGAAAGLFDGVSAIWSKGRALLNYLTYYTMKGRAGDIGAGSLGPILSASVVGKTRLHLVGHSFGARLVTAAANSLPAPGSVSSISLLQAAFSHNSFAVNWIPGQNGGFRHLIDNNCITGSMIITHTRNDKAVGIAYAIASSIAGQNAEDVGDANSQYGGLGSNGAQHTPEADNGQPLQAAGSAYTFSNRVVYNLLADQFISGHGDVTNPAAANAVLQAVAAAPHEGLSPHA